MKKKFLIPLVGIHSAGKSTVRNVLAAKGFRTEEECAEILRTVFNLKAGANADLSFERVVRQEETLRDSRRSWIETDIVFVESWHILTLAYMLTRGTQVSELSEYLDYVKAQMQKHDVYCIFLKSDPHKILERSRKLHTESDIGQYYSFYERLEENIRIVINLLDVNHRVFDSMKSIEETMEEIVEYISSFYT